MKYIITLFLIAAFALTASAQEQTLFNAGARVTGFGGPGVYYTTFNNDPHVLVGGQGAVLLNSTVYVGGAGYGLASQPDAGVVWIDGQYRDTDFEGGYGGFLLGIVTKSNDVIHTSADVLIGGGSINQVRDEWRDDDWDHDDNDAYETDNFFTVQPMAHAELNVFPWMRVNASAGYRFVSGMERFDLDNDEVGGPVAGLGFRFGKF